ncbi:MAG TPA: putative maltokinase [Gemmataceae bacterium]|jgi:maltose alpha-D-glucosyltransferase/alpha-amylase|nr:putative maltokinase [Gemmataceae bacterium]
MKRIPQILVRQLAKSPNKIAVRRLPVPIEEIKEVPLLAVGGKWTDIMEDGTREKLENVLPRYLSGQRWFGGKARSVQAVRIFDWTVVPAQHALVFWILLKVEFQEGAFDLYSLPLGVVAGPGAQSQGGRVVARLSGLKEERLLIDALADDAACMALLSAIAGGRELATRNGLIRAEPTAAFAALRGPPGTPLPVVQGPTTSSNSLVVFGRRLLLKLFRRLDAGINPELEIGRFLTEKTRFSAIPQTGGSIIYLRRNTEPITLAILQQLVPNNGDCWHQAIDELERFFNRTRTLHDGPDESALENHSWLELVGTDPPPGVLKEIGSYLQVACTLGERTADLHLALAKDKKDPAFAPEPMTVRDLEVLAAGACRQGRQALAVLREKLDSLPEALGPSARAVLKEGQNLLKQSEALPAMKINAAKIRCHGDYHLGQVLRTENDLVIVDFEGEPARPIAERRAKQSPLKDVAGMLRSFSYAAYAGLFAFTQHRPQDLEILNPWAELWQRWTAVFFLKEYLATAEAPDFLPADPDQFSTLLQFFMLEKTFYELVYELNNRPDWVRIPLEGILSLGRHPVTVS